MLVVGAALFLGTAAALIQHRRTGEFPGHDPSSGERPSVRGAVARTVVGALLAIWGAIGVATTLW